jgi:glycine reductase
MSGVKVVHYLNQFFGGIGGEDRADIHLTLPAELPRPSGLVQEILGPRAFSVTALVAGDNFSSQHAEEFAQEALAYLARVRPGLLIAGPAFNAGRYGMACGFLCQEARRRLGIPAVTAMHAENPGVQAYRAAVPILKTGSSPVEMKNCLERLADLGLRLARGAPLGPAAEEGIFGSGLRLNRLDPRTAAARAVDMLVKKMAGRSLETELPVPDFTAVAPAPPVADVRRAALALVTTGGIVPRGNPDHLPVGNSTRWGAYSIEGLGRLDAERFQSIHRGYDTARANEDPNRVLPLDGLRALQEQGLLGALHPRYYVTSGQGTYVTEAVRMANEIADGLEEDRVHAVLLVAT